MFLLRKLRRQFMMISRFATKVHQTPIVYMGKLCQDAIYSQFWEGEAGEHSIKLSRPETCRIKKNNIIANIEIKRYQNRDEKGGKKESGERACTSVCDRGARSGVLGFA